MQTKQKIILKCDLPPGDLCTLTAAIESLHLLFPDQYLTDVYTSCTTRLRRTACMNLPILRR
jgi:hypothetical protein